MSGYLPQLTRPGRLGDRSSTQAARHQVHDTEAQLNRSPTDQFQGQGDRVESHVVQAPVSGLLEWHVTTAAGLREKEEKLRLTQNLAERQKRKIEELRKTNEVLGTDLANRNEENIRFKERLASTKEEVEIMAKQVMSVSMQLKRLVGERLEVSKIKEERKGELQKLTETINKLQVAQSCKVKNWEDKLIKEEENLGIKRDNAVKAKDAQMKEVQALEVRMSGLDETINTITEKITAKEADLTNIGAKMESMIQDVESAKLANLGSEEKVARIENFLVEKTSEFEVREREMCLKFEKIDACLDKVKMSSREKQLLVVEKDDEVQGIHKAILDMKDRISELEMKKNTYELNMVDKEQLLSSYKEKVEYIDRMKSEITALTEELKVSEEKRCTAEEEYKVLGDIQQEKDNLEDENQKLSQEVHDYEAKVQRCKSEVTLAQEGVKEKIKNVGTLEVQVQEMEAVVRNKTRQVEKVKQVAETTGRRVTGSKSSSSDLRVKLEALDVELNNRTNDCELRRNSVENLKSELDKLNRHAETLKIQAQDVIDAGKVIEKDCCSIDKDVSGTSDELKKLDAEVGEVEDGNHSLSECVKAGQDKIDEMTRDLKMLIDDSQKIEEERIELQRTFQNVAASNRKVEAENKKLKKNIKEIEEEMKESVGRMENTASIKNSLKAKIADIKNLEKEVKNAKKNQVTVSKRRDKLARQFEKNKGSLIALEADGVKSELGLKMAQESLDSIMVQNNKLSDEKTVKEKTLEGCNADMEKFVANVDELNKIVKDSKSKLDKDMISKDKLLCDVNKGAQELKGLLVLKDREYAELQARSSNELTELEMILSAKKKDLEAKSISGKTSSDDEHTSQENELNVLSKQSQGVKEELVKLEEKLADKKIEVDGLRLELNRLQKVSCTKARNPLGVITPEINAMATKSQHASFSNSSRQNRSLLGTVKSVPQSPVRSFLAPPSRNISSRHSKKKPAKKPSGKIPPAPIVDFDSVMGVSDDMDSC